MVTINETTYKPADKLTIGLLMKLEKKFNKPLNELNLDEDNRIETMMNYAEIIYDLDEKGKRDFLSLTPDEFEDVANEIAFISSRLGKEDHKKRDRKNQKIQQENQDK